MTANVDAMVRAGIEAYRANKKAEARKLLEKAIELDDYNEQAWMWLSAVVETPEEQKTCLENVIVINPENEEAKRGLKMLGVQDSAPSAEAGNSSPFNANQDAFGSADFTAETNGEDWSTVPPTASSSASSSFQGNDVSASEYDDWVSGLGLGSNDAQNAPMSSASTATPFGGSNAIDDMFDMDSDEDFFSDDPFGSEPMFDDDDDDATSFTSGPFGGTSFEDDFELDTPPPAKKPAPPKSAKPAPAPSAPIKSPAAENLRDSLFDDLDSASFSSGSDFAGGDFFTGDVAGQGSGSDLAPDEYFGFIPAEITATRLPGEKEGIPVASLIITLVLLMLNAGAIAFVVSSLG